MTDRYERIRKALEMGPTPGPFSAVRSYSPGNQELIIRITCNDEYGMTETYCTVRNSLGGTLKTEADAAFITACDPDTIRTLLAERDALAAALEAAREDAARYRWLRDPCSGAERVIFYCRGDYGRGLMSGSMLDAAIDDALLKERENKS